MKSPHRAAALRGLLYCAAILIKKFLVDNAEIRSGAEKSMVLPDCRVEFFSSVRRRRALFQRRPLSPTRFAMRYPRRLSRRFRWSAPGQECFHTSFPKPLSDIHGVHRDRAADPTPAQRTDPPLLDCRSSSSSVRTRRTSDRPPDKTRAGSDFMPESALKFQLAAPVALVHFCAEHPAAYPQCQGRFPVWFRHSRGLSEQLCPSS